MRRAPFLLGLSLLPATLWGESIGLHFTENYTNPRVSDGPADGFSNWTDSCETTEGNFFANGTNVSLKGGGPVRATWQSSNGWYAGSEADNEKALYRSYLDDGNVGAGTGVRVTLTKMARWLALNQHTSYQIRCYGNNDSNILYRPISVRNGDITGTVLETITIAPLGDGNYPPGSVPTSGESRGYIDSSSTLTSDTVSLTIASRSGGTRGTLTAFKVTGIGTGAPVDHFESGDGMVSVVNAALGAAQTSVFRAGLDIPTVTGTFSVAAGHQVQVVQPAGGFTVGSYNLLTLPAGSSVSAGDFTLKTLPRGTTGALEIDTSGATPVLKLTVSEVTIPSALFWTGAVAGGVWDVDTTDNWSYESAPSGYLDGDEVVFDDTVTGTTSVALNVQVLPFSVKVDNDGTHPYSITGTGAINGAGTFTKLGAGTLTLGTANGYAGATSINGGTVTLGSNTALGSASAGTMVLLDAKLDVNGMNIGGEPLSLDGSGGDGMGVLVNNSATAAAATGTITLSGTVTIGGSGGYTLGTITGGGSLVKIGAGQVTTSSGFGFTGTFTLDEGQWTIMGGNTLGSCSETIINDGGNLRCVGDNRPFGGGASDADKITINQGGTLSTPDGSCHLGALVFDGGTLTAETIRTDWANYNFDGTVSTAGTGKTSYITGGNVTVSKTGGTNFEIGSGDTLEIASKIDGDTGASDTGLIKNGPGTLALTADNTYDSPTTVNAGTLKLAGSLRNTSAVTVATGASITGTGAAHGSVAVQAGATVAPGGAAPVGTLTCGSATMAGTFQCQLDGANCDTLAVTGALDLTGGTIALSTINAPTAPVLVLASAASITGTPTITGTVPAGYTLQTTATQVRLMSATAGFSGWIGGFGLAAADQDLDDDADADGLDNGIEYVLGGNPATVSDVAKLPQGVRSGGNFVFTFDRVVASETPDIALSFQHGDTLTSWTTVSLESANPPQVAITRSGDNLTDHIVVTIPASGTRLFGRLKVTTAP
jgi:fibronectin-binding autotransporter adhesin